MVESSRLVFKLLCVKLKSLNFDFILVDICMKIHDASLYGLKVIERTRYRHDFVRDKVQRKITQKI